MFRIPCTKHEKTNLYKVPITYSELQNLSHQGIKDIAKEKREIVLTAPIYNSFANARYKDAIVKADKEKNVKFNFKGRATLKCTPPCIKHIIDTGSTEGNRNNTLAALSSFYRNSGVSYEEAISKLEDWNTRNSPPIKSIELKRTARSIYTSNASYGCSSLKEISICNEKECQLKKKGNTKL